jgi:hypothetical protein
MDKSFLIYLAFGAGFFYFITTFIGDLEKEDDKQYQYNKKQTKKYAKYKTVDSVGQEVLDVTGSTLAVQIDVWHHSDLKNELISIFPNFSEMKFFISDRIVGEELENKLLQVVADVEDGVISGTMSIKQAKMKLDSL